MQTPEVECIAKGKAHKHDAFGVKVSVATTNRDNFLVGIESLPSNPYDGHTLERAIEQVTALTGKTPKRAYVDRWRQARGDDMDQQAAQAAQCDQAGDRSHEVRWPP
jgi:hypothetical protein